MKRIAAIAVLFGAFALFSQPVIEPIEEPIEVKPILVSTAKQWDLTGAYYQKVTMPDGSKQELKEWKPLTTKQWQAMADEAWKNREIEPEPQICPHCGQEYWP